MLTLLSRVAYGGKEVTGPRLRGLLALLAGDLRSGCGTTRLIEGLWPDEQPENPVKALQVLVSRTRTQLGPELIASTPTGYRIALPADQVDAAALLLKAGESTRLAREGDHAAALAVAEAGLALWDGGESAGNDPVSVLRTRSATAHQELVRSRALALARLGRHDEALAPLVELCAERRRDEELLNELLRCEAATTGTSAALARYEDYRRKLRADMGTDPGKELRSTAQLLLRPTIRRGISHEPNELLGREADIAAVTGLLRTARVTSIVGPGGLGKTRLANVVSRMSEQRVVQLVPLAGITQDADVLSEVASALGVGEAWRSVGRVAVSKDMFTSVVGALSQGPMLLVLDNCEQVIEGAAELVRQLIAQTKDLRVLTTSRAPLGLSSESVYPLPELTLPTTVELFTQRARSARPTVELPETTVAELCTHLDGLPLAVELAAARVRVMSVTEIARRLDDRFSLLRGGSRDAPERHRTLHAVVDWSWNLLEPAARAALSALSIFPNGFTADAAGYLTDITLLDDLVDQSLIKITETAAGIRFRMLETVREFSATYRETQRVIPEFLRWARDFGVTHHESPFGPTPGPDLEMIRAEQDNLTNALRIALDADEPATVAAITAVLGVLWTVDSDYLRMLNLAGEASRPLSHFHPTPEYLDVTRTALTMCAVNVFMLQGPRALRSLVALRRLPPAPPDTVVRAISLVFWTSTAELVELSTSAEPLLAGLAHGTLSYIRENEGRVDAALEAAQRMLDALKDRRSPMMNMQINARIAELCLYLGQGTRAREHMLAALEAQEALNQHTVEIGIRAGLALAELQRGDMDEAARWLDLAERIQPDDLASTTFTIGVRAEICLARGDIETGLANWRAAIHELTTSKREDFPSVALGSDPWVVEVQCASVIAHYKYGKLPLISDTAAQLPEKLATMLANPLVNPPPYYTELPSWGALLLAVALTDIDRGATELPARMIALAQRLQFHQQFVPTMSLDYAQRVADEADGSAYTAALVEYAELDRDGLRTTALALLADR